MAAKLRIALAVVLPEQMMIGFPRVKIYFLLQKNIFPNLESLMQDEKVLLDNFQFFLSKKSELLSDSNIKHKFVVVYGKEIKGVFENFEDAHMWAKGKFADENFIIQHIIDEDEIADFVYEAVCR